MAQANDPVNEWVSLEIARLKLPKNQVAQYEELWRQMSAEERDRPWQKLKDAIGYWTKTLKEVNPRLPKGDLYHLDMLKKHRPGLLGHEWHGQALAYMRYWLVHAPVDRFDKDYAPSKRYCKQSRENNFMKVLHDSQPSNDTLSVFRGEHKLSCDAAVRLVVALAQTRFPAIRDSIGIRFDQDYDDLDHGTTVQMKDLNGDNWFITMNGDLFQDLEGEILYNSNQTTMLDVTLALLYDMNRKYQRGLASSDTVVHGTSARRPPEGSEHYDRMLAPGRFAVKAPAPRKDGLTDFNELQLGRDGFYYQLNHAPEPESEADAKHDDEAAIAARKQTRFGHLRSTGAIVPAAAPAAAPQPTFGQFMLKKREWPPGAPQ